MPPSPLQSPRPAVPSFFRPRHYTKQQAEDEAPSVRAGMTLKRVAINRKNYVNMITNVCKKLGLNNSVRVAAINFLHHFYLVRVRTGAFGLTDLASFCCVCTVLRHSFQAETQATW